MEKQVIYRDNQELQAGDLIDQQTWTQQAIDHLILDAIDEGKAYSGFVMSKSAQTQIQTTPGRLYNAGSVYAREETVTLDLYNDLPVSTKRQFALVAWGATVEEDIEPRNFVIDADTGQAEPQSVAMRTTRYCNINYKRGIESADPQPPSVDVNECLIGYIVCDSTGILSFTQSTATQIDNLTKVAVRTSALEIWRQIISGAIDTLRTDLANLAKSLSSYTPLVDFLKLVDIVDIIYKRVFQPGVYIYYGQDEFLDETLSDTAGSVEGAYSARVAEGLRFPGGGEGWQGGLQLLNPNEPLVTTSSDDFTLPRPSGSRVRYDCLFPHLTWTEVRLLTFGYWNFNCRHLRPARWRFRCGPHFLPNPPASVWWSQSKKDPIHHYLSFSDETWEDIPWEKIAEHHEFDIRWPRYVCDRWKFFWRDYTHLPHWGRVFNDYSHSANHIAHTFYNAQDGWITGITLMSMRAVHQPLTILITGCDDQGCPDHANHTLRRVVLDATAVQTCYSKPIHVGDIHGVVVIDNDDNGVTDWRRSYEVPLYAYPVRINFPPTFLRAGYHYAFHVLGTHDHYFAVCDDDDEPFQVHQGHFWHSDGVRLVAWASGRRSLRFQLHFATWGRWGAQVSPGGQLRYEINLQPLQLAGGIGSVDVLAEHIIPPACNVSYEVQIGGVWRPFASDTDAPSFSGNPALLPFRMVMTGTTDLMPGVSFENSEVTLTRAAATTFHHISDEVTLGTPTNSIKVITKAHQFDEDHHDLVVTLYYGTTHDDQGVDVDEVLSDGTLQRTTTFTVSAVSAYQILIDGTQDEAVDPFFVSQRITYAT